MEYIRKGRKRCLVFKVDFEKAFDSISWDFLICIMRQMGFGEKWCKWIETCLRSASVSILINGSPTVEFQMSKGIKQGDPLSPFLFIIATKGLNVVMKEAISKGIFKGVKVGKDMVEISHLQYADDAIFLGERSRSNVRNLLGILKCFQWAFDLKINLSKSKLLGVGVQPSEVDSMAFWVGCKVGISVCRLVLICELVVVGIRWWKFFINVLQHGKLKRCHSVVD